MTNKIMNPNRIAISTILLLVLLVVKTASVTHWKTTESGRIESEEDSPFSLLRPYDLAAFLKQFTRLERLNFLKDLISSRDLINKKDATHRGLNESFFFEENMFIIEYSP